MSKLPHLIKKPSNTWLFLPNPDHCLFLLWTVPRAFSRVCGLRCRHYPAHSPWCPQRAWPRQRGGPQPPSAQAPLWLPVSLRGCVRLLAGYQGCSKPASPELHLWQLSFFHSTFITQRDGAGTQCCDFVAESYFLFHPHFLNIQPSYHFFQAPFPASPSRGNALTCRVTSVF